MDYNMNNGYYQQPEQTKGNGFRIWFLIAAAVVLVAAVAIGAIVLVNNKAKEQEYITAVNLGNEYFMAGDYYNAVIQYQLAIAANDKEESSYLNMSSIYMIIGDYSSARNIVLQGLEKIDSEALRARLSELEGKSSSTLLSTLSATQISNYSINVVAENNFFDMVASYTYTDYMRDYGQPVSSSRDGDSLLLNYATVNFQTVYYDLPDERVLDNAKNTPLAAAKPCYVTFQSLRSLFASDEDVYVISFDKLKDIMGDTTAVSYDEVSGMYLVTAKYKGCQITLETDESGNVLSESAWNKLEPLSRQGMNVEENVEGEVSGYVQDALTGQGMVATIKVRARGDRNGQILAEITSAFDGNYVFGGEQGQYTLEITAPGYTTEYIDVEVVRGQTKMGQNVVLSPVVGEGEIRIVLSWDASPSDLDSHVEGRSSSGGGFHIYYGEKNYSGVGSLDVDDTNGYGPETITITDANANFTYRVHDFTGSGTMASSNAIVKVYLPGNAGAIVFYVPAGSGNNWEVFKYENGQVNETNYIH